MSESRVRENRTHGSMWRREAPHASRHRRAALAASRRPYRAAPGEALVGAQREQQRTAGRRSAPVRLAVLIALSVMSDAQEMVPGRRRADSLFQAVGRWA